MSEIILDEISDLNMCHFYNKELREAILCRNKKSRKIDLIVGKIARRIGIKFNSGFGKRPDFIPDRIREYIFNNSLNKKLWEEDVEILDILKDVDEIND